MFPYVWATRANLVVWLLFLQTSQRQGAVDVKVRHSAVSKNVFERSAGRSGGCSLGMQGL